MLFEIYFVYKVVTEAIYLVTEAWRLGGEQLKKYVDLATSAAAANTTVEFFQRITQAATAAKLPVDTLMASLKTLNDTTAGKLGGSAAQLSTDALQTAGHFQGNTGVAQLQTANSLQEKLQAVANLYDQAVAKGERLAALDVAKTVLGDTVAANLAKNNGYLDKMLISAAAISAETLLSDADAANALDLQTRLDAAEKIFRSAGTRFKPF